MVYFTFNPLSEPRGPGYFKLNNSILLNNEYQNIIRNSIQNIVDINRDANDNTKWEIIKGTVRNESIKFASKIKKDMDKNETKLKTEIDKLENDISNDTDNNEILESLEEKKKQLEEINEKRTEGIIIRAKADWVEGAEKNTSYFAKLEKYNAEKKNISKLIKNNVELVKTKDILTETKDFFEKVYKKNNSVINNDDFFNNSFLKQLTDNQKDSCEGKLNINECGLALLNMKNNKSPGSDGLTTEFYKIFWTDIKHYFVNSINFSYNSGQLTQLQKQGIISLIPKKDKELTNLNNWRPITLLNIDYKIATKAMPNRMKNVLPNIINNCQTGFLKGRYIGENIRLLFDIIEHSLETNKPGCLIFADFEKAFDSLDHNFMLKTLSSFNFGESFLKWINLFYTDIQTCVYNNGHMSDFFNVERGVRQGCPLSPYLFISTDNNIKGIALINNEV